MKFSHTVQNTQWPKTKELTVCEQHSTCVTQWNNQHTISVSPLPLPFMQKCRHKSHIFNLLFLLKTKKNISQKCNRAKTIKRQRIARAFFSHLHYYLGAAKDWILLRLSYFANAHEETHKEREGKNPFASFQHALTV